MFNNFAHRNRFGAWVVNGQNYYNKLSAVVNAVKSGHWIHWDFNDTIFEKHNWSQEPSESLDTLYGNRARQLRERYDHIAVEFSGGADSWNLLYHFCRQGLHVDSVIHRYAGETVTTANDQSSTNQWAEGRFQAWPSFQKLLDINPSLTWKTWDIVDPIMQGWKSAAIDFSVHNNFHPGGILKTPDLAQHNPFGIPNLESSAMVYGVDKPIVEFQDGKFYLVFYDHQVILRSVLERQLLGVSMQDIFFYWDPDCIDMMAKQGHIIMNWFRRHPDMIKVIKDKPTYLNIINRLIYPDYQPIWQSKKPEGLFAQTHENWFINNTHLSGSKQWHNIMHNYTSILENAVNGTGYEKYIKQDHTSDYKVLSSCPSRAYYLGDL
jgi:hypothetical protein